MMKHKTRLAALTLAAVLALSALAGCSAGGTETVPREGEFQTEDIISRLTDGALTRDTALLTVNGDPITAEELLFWALYDCDELAYYYYGSAANIPWDSDYQEGVTLEDYVLSDAMTTAKLYRLLHSNAAANDLGPTAEQQDELLADKVDALIAEQGSKEEFLEWLNQLGISYKAYYTMNAIQYEYKNHLSALSAEDVQQYISENELYRVKHILISALDENDQPLGDEEKAAALQRAQELLAQLRSSDDPITLFDTLMAENSADPGLAYYPDGYLSSPGEMDAAFEAASLALEENEISDIVESEFGYHIILRLNADTTECRSSYFEETLGAWMDSARVEETEAYGALDLPALYTALEEYRLSLEEAQDPAETTPAETTPAG